MYRSVHGRSMQIIPAYICLITSPPPRINKVCVTAQNMKLKRGLQIRFRDIQVSCIRILRERHYAPKNVFSRYLASTVLHSVGPGLVIII